MTTGTTAPYMELPEDINPPKPGFFHDVFHMVNAYIELLHHVPESAIPGRGLIRLYSHRMGVLEPDTSIIETAYADLVNNNMLQRRKFQAFAQSAIAYNITTLYRMLSNTLISDLARDWGDDKCLSMETVHALNQFAKLQETLKAVPAGVRQDRYDSMNALVTTCHYNATYRHDGVTSSEAIIRAIEALDKVVESPESSDNTSVRTRLLNALKIVFYIGCRYYHLNILRFSDELINRSYDRLLDITDLTLAAIPFDPTLIYGCPDNTSSISKWGIEYVQSLEAVLLYFGGIQYSALLAVDANGNKGVSNV